MVKEMEMEKVMEKIKALYDVLVKKVAENDKLAIELKEKKDEVVAKLDQVKELENELKIREKAVSNVEDVVLLKEQSDASVEEAVKILTEAKKVRCEIDDKALSLIAVESGLAATKKNLESQQKSLNDEAVRLEKDRKEMKEKLIAKIAKGV